MANSPLPAPSPLLAPNQPVDWLFIFKFNAGIFPGCYQGQPLPQNGIFGGTVEDYEYGYSMQYVYASSQNPALTQGTGCLGATTEDPLGATFAQVYNNPGYNYVIWNDQFYNNPLPVLYAPWGHSKGMLVWNENGDGFVMQASTPSWPASGSILYPRQNDGNTLGYVNDDDIEVSQHFFMLKVNASDVTAILQAIQNASVVTGNADGNTNLNPLSVINVASTDPNYALVNSLGVLSTSTTPTIVTLSSGVQLISKPSNLNVPPWQMVSSLIGSPTLRVACWWEEPYIYSTYANTQLGCWSSSLNQPGGVEIATSGHWNGNEFSLVGGEGGNFNHAKIGITVDGSDTHCIFGDMNQQGALWPAYAYSDQTCSSSQNGRGGTFYVLNNATLNASIYSLINGTTAPTWGPNGNGEND